MSRNRFRFPRRGAHPPGFDSNCVRLTPPLDDPEGFFIGFCGDLNLWRVKLPGFDRYGAMDEERDMRNVRQAIRDAAESVRESDPELAERLAAISDAVD